jgi:hypothetical protein
MNSTRTGFFLLLAFASPLAAAEHVIYPSAGQDAEQQAADEAQCLVWAREESGVDPLSPPDLDVDAPARQRGGALRGAAVGAVIGEIADDEAGEGAAIGAAAGAARQRGRNRRAQAEAAAEEARREGAWEADLERFDRHYVACLRGRDYSVN